MAAIMMPTPKGESMLKYHGKQPWYNLEKPMPVVLLGSGHHSAFGGNLPMALG